MSVTEDVSHASKAEEARNDLFGQLDGVRQLTDAFKAADAASLSEHERVLHLLVEEVWDHTFMTYFALKRERDLPVEQ